MEFARHGNLGKWVNDIKKNKEKGIYGLKETRNKKMGAARNGTRQSPLTNRTDYGVGKCTIYP